MDTVWKGKTWFAFFVTFVLSLVAVGCSQLSTVISSELSPKDKFPREPLNNTVVSSYLDRVVENLSQFASRRNYRVDELKTSWAQGYAHFNSGRIEISRGMLNIVSSEDELAAIIAHEIGHHDLGHADKRYNESHESALEDIVSSVIGESGSKYNVDEWLDQQLNEVAVAGWSRSREEAADRYGAVIAAKAGYDPYALVDLFLRLANHTEDGAGFGVDFFKKTHADLGDRAEHLENYLIDNGYKENMGSRRRIEYWKSLSVLHYLANEVGYDSNWMSNRNAFMKERVNQDKPLWPNLSPGSEGAEELCDFIEHRATVSSTFLEAYEQLSDRAVSNDWSPVQYREAVSRNVGGRKGSTKITGVGGIDYEYCLPLVDESELRSKLIDAGHSPRGRHFERLLELYTGSYYVHESIHAQDCEEYYLNNPEGVSYSSYLNNDISEVAETEIDAWTGTVDWWGDKKQAAGC